MKQPFFIQVLKENNLFLVQNHFPKKPIATNTANIIQCNKTGKIFFCGQKNVEAIIGESGTANNIQ